MNLFNLLRPVAVLLVAAGILTLPDRASAAERAYHSRSTARLDFATGDFVAAGNATHLGNYTEVGRVTFLPDDQLEGWATFTAANCDKLCATFTGQLNADGTISATVTYDGGSGRFEHASGSASLVAQFQADGTLSVVVVGTIDY